MKRLLLSAFIAIFFIAQPAESGSALQEIKKNAKAKWPDDYTMQKYEVDNQVTARREVKHYKNKKIPS